MPDILTPPQNNPTTAVPPNRLLQHFFMMYVLDPALFSWNEPKLMKCSGIFAS